MKFKKYEMLFLVHFGELWLKGKNRGSYIRALKKNIGMVIDGEDVELQDNYDRFILRLGKKADIGNIENKLGTLFGISNYELAYVTKPELKAIVELSRYLLAKIGKEKENNPVKIYSHRSFKELKFNSMDIIEKVSKIAKSMELKVSNREYVRELRINVTKDAAFVSTFKKRVLGGLPVGTSGNGVILISGGIDSPVAAFYAMKRGIYPVFLHVHGYSDPEQAIDSKMRSIMEVLSRYSPHYKIYYVPSHIFELASLKTGPYQIILLKAFMLRLAEKIAKSENAKLIFTGESVGQVASQTPANLMASSYGLRIPVIRPLSGFDKEEIIAVARKIGTYDYSILPYKDVCSINARNPKTQARMEKIASLSKQIKMGVLVNRSLRAARVIEV